MRPNQLRVGLRVLLLLALVFSVSAGSNRGRQSGQALTINVVGPRPLAVAVRDLEQRYGWIVTYEDPPYVYEGDVEDITRLVARDYRPTTPKLVGPRSGVFVFDYVVPRGMATPDPAVLLRELVEAYNVSGSAGAFALTRTGRVFHVVPAASRDSAGTVRPRLSILDTKITIPDGERNALGMIESIRDAVNQSKGTAIIIGTVPLNLLARVRLRQGAHNESARAVLLRTLEATGRKLSWQLLNDGTSAASYGLNIHGVKD